MKARRDSNATLLYNTLEIRIPYVHDGTSPQLANIRDRVEVETYAAFLTPVYHVLVPPAIMISGFTILFPALFRVTEW
jgi:hypothetical protein